MSRTFRQRPEWGRANHNFTRVINPKGRDNGITMRRCCEATGTRYNNYSPFTINIPKNKAVKAVRRYLKGDTALQLKEYFNQVYEDQLIEAQL